MPQIIIHSAEMDTELEHTLSKKLPDGLGIEEIASYSP